MKNYQALQNAFMTDTYPNRGLTFLKGKGMYLFDEKNNPYLDVMSNYGVTILGHVHPEVTQVLSQQLQTLTTLHGSFASDKRAEAAKELIKKCGEEYKQVYFANSGAEAVETALKFAVLKTGKKKFIAFDHGYHGKTLGALSATSGEKYRKAFEPLLWDFIHVPYNDISKLEKTITPETGTVIIEPIQGEGGIFVPSAEYLKKVRELCTKNNIVLIVDEIQTGAGRTGTFLASQHYGISADILCLGKGLAGGIPVGATVITSSIVESITKGSQTSTFGGNPLACAGISVTLKLLDEDMLSHVTEMGTYFREQLKTIRHDLIVAIRGEGLMIGVEVKEKRNEILKALQNEKVLAAPAGDNVVRFLSPYIIEKKHIDRVVKALEVALTKV